MTQDVEGQMFFPFYDKEEDSVKIEDTGLMSKGLGWDTNTILSTPHQLLFSFMMDVKNVKEK